MLLSCCCQTVRTNPAIYDLDVVDPAVYPPRAVGRCDVTGQDHICHLATLVAHEVVVSMTGHFISGGARSGTGTYHQPGPGQVVERVEHRGARHGGTGGRDPGK